MGGWDNNDKRLNIRVVPGLIWVIRRFEITFLFPFFIDILFVLPKSYAFGSSVILTSIQLIKKLSLKQRAKVNSVVPPQFGPQTALRLSDIGLYREGLLSYDFFFRSSRRLGFALSAGFSAAALLCRRFQSYYSVSIFYFNFVLTQESVYKFLCQIIFIPI